jgi:hypothetical protein
MRYLGDTTLGQYMRETAFGFWQNNEMIDDDNKFLFWLFHGADGT